MPRWRLLCFPEGFLQGYLTDEPAAWRAALDLSSPAFAAMASRFREVGPMLVMGIIEVENGHLFNTAVVIERGALIGRYRKQHLLPGEAIFRPGTATPVFEIDGLRFGINICSDTNVPAVARNVADLGATLLVCPANNMMPRSKAETFRSVHKPYGQTAAARRGCGWSLQTSPASAMDASRGGPPRSSTLKGRS